ADGSAYRARRLRAGGTRICQLVGATVEWWLAPLRSIGARDLDEIQLFFQQVDHEMCEVVLGDEVLHSWRQQLRLLDVPGAKCLAHEARQNLTRDSLASKTRLLSGDYSDTLLAWRNLVTFEALTMLQPRASFPTDAARRLALRFAAPWD